MTRRHCIWLSLSLCSCRRSQPPAPLLPETLGAWRRTTLSETPVSEAPDPVPRSSVKRLETAAYEGPGQLQVRVYELTSAAVGLDLVQRWRPAADRVFVNPGAFFVVVQWEHADRKALQAFVAEMEKRLPN